MHELALHKRRQPLTPSVCIVIERSKDRIAYNAYTRRVDAVSCREAVGEVELKQILLPPLYKLCFEDVSYSY